MCFVGLVCLYFYCSLFFCLSCLSLALSPSFPIWPRVLGGVSEVAQQDSAHTTWVSTQNSHAGRRRLTPAHCLLTSVPFCMGATTGTHTYPQAHACMHTHTICNLHTVQIQPAMSWKYLNKIYLYWACRNFPLLFPKSPGKQLFTQHWWSTRYFRSSRDELNEWKNVYWMVDAVHFMEGTWISRFSYLVGF